MKTVERKSVSSTLTSALLIALTVIFIFPILLVFMNSFKSRLYVSTVPFDLPVGDMFVGFENYINGITTSGFLMAFIRSVFISVVSVALIIVCTSMTAWYIVRVKNKVTKMLYYIFVFSMIVPFQMVMYTMTFVVTSIYFDNVFGIVLVYLGFGAGLAVFMFTGFVKSIPLEVEEAATIDGCSPLQTFFQIVFPMLKPTAITVAILNAMWVWNDYLLPYLILGSDHKTVPVAIQLAMQGAYGSTDYGGFMAMLVVSIIPIIAFYISSQKYIIKGVIAACYLIKNGHKKIGVIGGNIQDSEVSKTRYQGFLQAMDEANLSFDFEESYQLSKYSMESGFDAAEKLLKKNPDITAIYTMSDVMAIGASRKLADMGIKVPDQISIIGFDGIEIGSFLCPRLTTIRQLEDDLVEQGLSVFLDSIENNAVSVHKRAPFEFVKGESVKNLN